jgi:hypothetical protein
VGCQHLKRQPLGPEHKSSFDSLDDRAIASTVTVRTAENTRFTVRTLSGLTRSHQYRRACGSRRLEVFLLQPDTSLFSCGVLSHPGH